MAKTIGPLLITLAAGVQIRNALAGEVFEVLESDAEVAVACTVPAAQANETVMSFAIGSQIVQDGGVVPIEGAAGVGPDLNTQVIARGFGVAGDRLRISLTSVAGGTAKLIVILDE